VELGQYARKPFFVEAVRVTDENISDVEGWCGGEVKRGPAPKFKKHAAAQDGQVLFIKVPVVRPVTDRQTMAYAGDWVVRAGQSFKVYTHKAFEESFQSQAVSV
jgi:hypothetical protein